MGWGDCGTDSKGRPIGYAFEGTCDHPGCEEKITRGLAYACGGMHGDLGGQACEGYFCAEHLNLVDRKAMGYEELHVGQLCEECLKAARENIADLVVSGDLRVIEGDDLHSKPSEELEEISRVNGWIKEKDMDIGAAVTAAKEGRRIRRAGWNGKGMYVYLARGGTFDVNPLDPQTMTEARSLSGRVDSYMVMHTAQGSEQPGWLCSQADLLADDWELAE